jgi:hypothetical protein
MPAIVFVDIDGCLNSSAFNKGVEQFKITGEHMSLMDDNPCEPHISVLNKIIQATDAKIVISSTWRTDANIPMWQRFFDMLGIKGQVVGITPKLGGFRGTEVLCFILDWNDPKRQEQWDIKGKGIIDHILILDDDSDFQKFFQPFKIKIDSMVGLQEEHIKPAIKILNKRFSLNISNS